MRWHSSKFNLPGQRGRKVRRKKQDPFFLSLFPRTTSPRILFVLFLSLQLESLSSRQSHDIHNHRNIWQRTCQNRHTNPNNNTTLLQTHKFPPSPMRRNRNQRRGHHRNGSFPGLKLLICRTFDRSRRFEITQPSLVVNRE